MDRLDNQKVGEKITAKWANEIVDDLRRQNIIPGNGIRKTVTKDGTIISLDLPKKTNVEEGEALSEEVYFAIANTTGSDDGSFKADLYNPRGQLVRRNVTVFLPDLTHYTRVKSGTQVLVHRLNVGLLAGDDGETA